MVAATTETRASTLARPSGRTPKLFVMLTTGLLLAVLAAAVLLVGDDGSSPLAAYEFTYEDGSIGDISDFSGSPVVIHFFASWVGPHRSDVPGYNSVHEQAGGRLVVLGINHDTNESDWRNFVDEFGVAYLTVHQPAQEVWTAVNGIGMPTTAFMSSDGEIVHVFSGVLDPEALEDLIQEHLGVAM